MTIERVDVRKGEHLQAALDRAGARATRGAAIELRLEPGAVYRGPFVIRNRGGAGPLTIRSAADDSNFGGSSDQPWIDPRYAEAMPALAPTTSDPVLTCEDGASEIRLFGLEVLPNTRYPDRDLIVFGRDGMTQLSDVPDGITIDRCYVHGDADTGQHRGLLFNVSHGTVTGCYFSAFMERGRDSQAIALWNGPGPITIEHSYLEATGENFLVGGADAQIPNLIPSEITLRGCHLFKPLAWIDTWRGSVKNLFELKTGLRVVVDGCVFENCWPDAQDGRGVVITVRSQDGGNPWATIADCTIRNSILKNIQGAAVSMLGLDDRPGIVTVQGTDLRLENLLLLNCRNGFQCNNGFVPTVIRHVTADRIVNWFLQLTNNPIPPGMLTHQDNVLPSGQYGIVGDGTGIGTPTLEDKAPRCTFDHNAIEQQNPYTIPLPAGNYRLEAGELAANLDEGYHYTGPERSSTGLPLGADPDAIRQAAPWALTGGR